MLRLFFAIDTTNGFAEQAQIGMQAKLFTGGVVPGLNSARSVRGIFPRVNPCGCASFRKSSEKLFRACKNIFARELKKGRGEGVPFVQFEEPGDYSCFSFATRTLTVAVMSRNTLMVTV